MFHTENVLLTNLYKFQLYLVKASIRFEYFLEKNMLNLNKNILTTQ